MLRKARSNAFPLSFSRLIVDMVDILDMLLSPVFMFIPGMRVFAAGLLMFIPLLCADTLLISTDAVNVKVVKSLFMWVTSSHKVVISCKGPVKQAFLKAVVSFISGPSVEAAEYLPALVCLLWSACSGKTLNKVARSSSFGRLWNPTAWLRSTGIGSPATCRCANSPAKLNGQSSGRIQLLLSYQYAVANGAAAEGERKPPSRIALRLGSEHLYLIPCSK